MRYRDVQRTFTKGELDPLLHARDDVVPYVNGAKRLRNVWVVPQGGAKRRPGLLWKATLPSALSSIDLSSATISIPNGGTAANLRDDDVTTASVTTTGVSTTDNFVAFEFDMGSDVLAEYAEVHDLKYSTTPTAVSNDEWTIEGKIDGGGSFEAIGLAAPRVDENACHLRVAPTKAYRYYRLIRNGTSDAGASTFVSVSEFRLWAATATLSNVELLPFRFSADQRYVMAVTDRSLQVYREGVLQAELHVPHTSAQLPEMTVAVKEDTVLLFHPDVQPHAIQRRGFHTRWSSAPQAFSNIPTYDFGSGSEASMSATRGWPRCGLFYAGRLLLGGLQGRPSTILGSRAGSVFDLDTSVTDDDYGFDITADPGDGKEVPTFHQLYEGPHLQAFSSSGEYYIPISDTQPLTPTNVSLRRTSSRGSKEGLRVFDVDGATYFVQRQGRALREFLFTDLEQKYSANNLSLLSSHLVRDPVDIDVLRSTSAEDADFVLVVNSDGTVGCFTTLRAQEVQAWSLGVVTDGTVVAVGVDGTDAYLAVRRNINGTDRTFFELVDFDTYTDAAVRATLGAPASSASGLDHLDGETVDILLDGALQAQQTVASGSVTFARNAESSWEVGLPWPDVQANFNASTYDEGAAEPERGQVAWVETLNDIIDGPRGTTRGKRRRIANVEVQVHRTVSMTMEGFVVPFRSFGANLLDQQIAPFTGRKRVGGLRGWARERTVSMGTLYPLPLHVLGLSYDLDVEE